MLLAVEHHVHALDSFADVLDGHRVDGTEVPAAGFYEPPEMPEGRVSAFGVPVGRGLGAPLWELAGVEVVAADAVPALVPVAAVVGR